MDLIIYHADCQDGFCAAFLAKKKYPEAELMPRHYGLEPPFAEVANKDVLVADFSWRKREDCVKLASLARSFRILDHHATAKEVLAGLDFALFDMGRSGAGIAWDELFGGARPWYVDYVEDRDLWRWALPFSREVSAYLGTLPHTVEAWNRLDNVGFDGVEKCGRAVLASIERYVETAVAHAQKGFIWGHSALVSNVPYKNVSEVGEALAALAEVGVGWFERGDGIVQFSLRSAPGGPDVSEIAKVFGGGGHKGAAGFQLPLAEGRETLDAIRARISQS